MRWPSFFFCRPPAGSARSSADGRPPPTATPDDLWPGAAAAVGAAALTRFVPFPWGYLAGLAAWAAAHALGRPPRRAAVLFGYLEAGSLVTRLLVLGVMNLSGRRPAPMGLCPDLLPECPMPKSVVIDVILITVRVPADLPDPRAGAVRRTLRGAAFMALLQWAIRAAVHASSTLAGVRVSLAR